MFDHLSETCLYVKVKILRMNKEVGVLNKKPQKIILMYILKLKITTFEIKENVVDGLNGRGKLH